MAERLHHNTAAAAVTLICGDALDELRRRPDAHFAAAVTSPPYNMGHTNNPGKAGPGGVRQPGRYRGGYGDDQDALPAEDYVAYHRAVLAELLRTLKPGGLVWYIHRRKSQSFPDGAPALVDRILAGHPVVAEIIWDKGSPGPGFAAAGATGGAYFPTASYETVFLLAPGRRQLRDGGSSGTAAAPGRRQLRDGGSSGTAAAAMLARRIAAEGDIWRIPRERVPGHPAPFPVALARRAIAATLADGPVLDPFGGSGSTALAARLEGRDAVIIERRAEYLDIARRRLAELPLPVAG